MVSSPLLPEPSPALLVVEYCPPQDPLLWVTIPSLDLARNLELERLADAVYFC